MPIRGYLKISMFKTYMPVSGNEGREDGRKKERRKERKGEKERKKIKG